MSQIYHTHKPMILDKVIDLAFFVSDGNKNKVDIAERFDFDERQGDYYANAARYLGFLDKDLTEFTLTELGKKFVTTRTVADRTLMIVRELLKETYISRINKAFG